MAMTRIIQVTIAVPDVDDGEFAATIMKDLLSDDHGRYIRTASGKQVMLVSAYFLADLSR